MKPTLRWPLSPQSAPSAPLTGTPADSLPDGAYVGQDAIAKRFQSRANADASVQFANPKDGAGVGDTRNRLQRVPLPRKGGSTGKEDLGYSSPLHPSVDPLYWRDGESADAPSSDNTSTNLYEY